MRTMPTRLLASPLLLAALLACQSNGQESALPSTTEPALPLEPPTAQSTPDAEIPIVPESQTWSTPETSSPSTGLALSHDRHAALAGEWHERGSLWDDCSLVYAATGRELCVIDGGKSAPRRLWKRDEERGSMLCDLAWSADAKSLYLWLDIDQQLCALDAETAAIRSLLQLDSHIWHIEGMRHLDPQPRFRPAGVLEDPDNHRLLVLLDEESNAEVAFWQRRSGRGGSWIAAVDLDDPAPRTLFQKSDMLEGVTSWDVSLKRGRLYALTLPLDITEYQPGRVWTLEERQLDGQIRRRFSAPDGKFSTIQLSPDEDRLLIERRYRPGTIIPPGSLDDMSREQVRALVASSWGGFVVMDVDTGKCIDGPGSGQDARWSPDGEQVAFVDGWAVKIASIDEHSIRDVIEGGPTESNWYTGTWIEPVWSPDGRRLAVTARSLDMTLLLDLESHDYFVIHNSISEKIWGLTPKPFASAPPLGM